ncbi:hypothetical protein TeGR_g12969, partial [Tetraparma gracilis]
MSWAFSYTGINSPFNDRQRIGITTSCPTPSATVDLVSTACHHDIRTFLVRPGDELAVKAAVAEVCQRPEVKPVDFRFIMELPRQEHMTPDLLSGKIEAVSKKLGVDSMYMVLLPWPAEAKDPDAEPFNRMELTRQAKAMRNTWDVLCGLVERKQVNFLGVRELSNPQIEALMKPSPPQVKPPVLIAANWMKVSVWKSEMHRVRFCHSMGIQVLADFEWDLNRVNGGGAGASDKVVEMVRKNQDGRSAMQILTLWGVDRGLVVFPNLDHVKNRPTPKLAEEFDKERKITMDAIDSLSLLLSPLFRKKPMWKEAFALTEGEMKALDEIDGAWNNRLNEKLLRGDTKWGKEKAGGGGG